MQEQFYRVTTHFTKGKPLPELRRFVPGTRSKIGLVVLEKARLKYRAHSIKKVDAWWVPDTDPEVLAYKNKWT